MPVFAQQEVYVVSNNIDIVSKEVLEDYFRGFGLFPEFLYPEEAGQIKGAKLLIILGGPDALYGTGLLVTKYLDSLEIGFKDSLVRDLLSSNPISMDMPIESL